MNKLTGRTVAVRAVRQGFWLAGALAGGSLVWILRSLVSPGTLILGVGAVMLFAALVGELIVAFTAIRSTRRVIPPPNAQPADGRIERLVITGATGEPNRRDPRFSAFRALRPVENLPPPARLPSGSMPPLLGRITLVSLFVGRDQHPWSDDEIARAHAALFRAGEWIEREAIRWKAPVNLTLADTYFVVDDDEATNDVEMTFEPEGESVGPLEAHAVTKALIDTSRAASKLGFRDAVDWMEQIRARVDADALVWLLHPRRAGRSLAIPLDLTELAGVSLAVCYARESSFPEPLIRSPFTDPVTVVHELLHLFGASDKYGVPLRSYPPRSVSPRDIMRLNELSLSRLRIDRQTAWEIGWEIDDALPRDR
ncbi:hypothetical protein SAMN05444166_6204 [Singulisphaera sp. GP187]|uniref:hypothetical protein n=1 Tax=Singulisphaera sp. GP187 TaxID=1882752 RepID=UPI000927E837|nr:hypothetical protein [Singulisphaera sp. GP187]SIO59910.1 hypothetical protein SAMN05444166_6204 [Singulisphaera sp. GP187]